MILSVNVLEPSLEEEEYGVCRLTLLLKSVPPLERRPLTHRHHVVEKLFVVESTVQHDPELVTTKAFANGSLDTFEDCGMIPSDLVQVLFYDNQQGRLFDCRDRGHAYATGQHLHLAEDVAGPDPSEYPLLSRFRGPRDLDFSLDEHEEVRAGVALLDEDIPRSVLASFTRSGERLESRSLEVGKERTPTKLLLDLSRIGHL